MFRDTQHLVGRHVKSGERGGMDIATRHFAEWRAVQPRRPPLVRRTLDRPQPCLILAAVYEAARSLTEQPGTEAVGW
jgi:argininosuccinate lyase